MNNLIQKIVKQKDLIKIIWTDNKVSKFHFLWLRDNCSSNQHPIARQKVFNIIEVSKNIYPKKVFINNKNDLEILWSEKNHKSYFKIKWLRSNCYTIKSKNLYKSPFKFWNSNYTTKLDYFKIDHDAIIKDDKYLLKWLELLNKYGISIIKNAPLEKKSALKLLNRISHIRETFFKTPFEVINIPKPNNAAYTYEALFNHTDLPYFEYSPGYQFLHCLSNDAIGGDSSIVDGYAVSDYLKKTDNKTYNLLLKTPIKFKDNDFTQDKIRIIHSPIITLDKNKDYKDIRFNISTNGAFEIHPNKMKKYYLAYRKFSKLVHSSKFSVKFRLLKGDILSFDNRRVLHGRTAFNPNSGNRHLQGYYMDRDEILAKLNSLKKTEV